MCSERTQNSVVLSNVVCIVSLGILFRGNREESEPRDPIQWPGTRCITGLSYGKRKERGTEIVNLKKTSVFVCGNEEEEYQLEIEGTS